MIDLLFGGVDENAEKLVKILFSLFSFLPEDNSYLIFIFFYEFRKVIREKKKMEPLFMLNN